MIYQTKSVHTETETIYKLIIKLQGLTKLDYTQHMLLYRTINLADNCLAINSLGGLRNLKSVQTLLLDSNHLGAVPSVISELTSLKLLSLQNNSKLIN